MGTGAARLQFYSKMPRDRLCLPEQSCGHS